MYLIPDTQSSLIREIEYDEDNLLLYVRFQPKYYLDELCYKEVDFDYFIAFSEANSLGKFYLRLIKPNFKIKPSIMADKPKTINQSSDQFRWIDISINVKKINKKWIFAGEKGDWLHLSMRMQPDGEVDSYGNLGMITQKVPKKIYEAEIKVPKDKKTRGNILGNACEFERQSVEGDPGEESGEMLGDMKESEADKVSDDLPF